MKKIFDDVDLKCLKCGSNMMLDYIRKVGMCSSILFYKCPNCAEWIARKDIFDKYLLNVHYEKVDKE